jgi:hypothetical protein
MDGFTLEHQVFYMIHVKCKFARSARENLAGSSQHLNSPEEHYSESCKETSTTGVLTDKKTSQQCTVIPEETLDNLTVQLEHAPFKLLRQLAQEIEI